MSAWVKHKAASDDAEMEWIDTPNPQWPAHDIRNCSKCGWSIPKSKLRSKDLYWNFCPNCGRRNNGRSNVTVPRDGSEAEEAEEGR